MCMYVHDSQEKELSINAVYRSYDFVKKNIENLLHLLSYLCILYVHIIFKLSFKD